MAKEKIFGIGIGRTGTKSLSAALDLLGYKTVHWLSDKTSSCEVLTGAKVSRVVERNEAIVDTILPLIYYKEYANRFPDARFILTIRDVESWLQSIKRHMIKMRAHDSENYSSHLYGSLILKSWELGRLGDEQLIKAYVTHNNSVMESFAGDPNRLLVMDIINGDGWDKLCGFLSKEVPDVKFPKRLRHQSIPGIHNPTFDVNTLALATVILPRMEIDHLEEWLYWHYMIGVRDFWIVCDYPNITDSDMNQHGGQSWVKKPWANYHLDLTDSEARDEIESIVRKCDIELPYINIRMYDMPDIMAECNPCFSHRQVFVGNKLLPIAKDLVNWLGMIDVDELLDIDSIDKLNHVSRHNQHISTLRVYRQRLMGNRFEDGKPIKYHCITKSWGVIPSGTNQYLGNGKSFIRPGRGIWSSVHRAEPIDDGANLMANNMSFYHFHGINAIDKTLELGWDKIYQWAKEHSHVTHHDDHCKILDKKNIYHKHNINEIL